MGKVKKFKHYDDEEHLHNKFFGGAKQSTEKEDDNFLEEGSCFPV